MRITLLAKKPLQENLACKKKFPVNLLETSKVDQ